MTKKNGKKDGKKGQKKRRSDRVPFSPWAGVAGAAVDPFDDAPDDIPAVTPEPILPAPIAPDPEPGPPALIQIAAAPRGAASLNVVSNGREAAPSATQHNPAPEPMASRPADSSLVPLSPEGCNRLAAYLAAVTLFCLFGVVMSWPASASGEVATGLDRSLLLLALFSGGLGACIHAVQSFTTFMGNRRLSASWVPWYLLRPLIGMSLAFLAYVIVRVGLIQSSPDAVNPAGIAAIGGLAGLFAKQALQKLAEVSDTLFRVQHPHEEKDGLTPGSAQVPTRESTRRGS